MSDLETELLSLNARVIAAEGQVWGLTELLKALIRLEILPKTAVKAQLAEMIELLNPDPTFDEPTADYVKAAKALLEKLLNEPAVPRPPPFTIIDGGKTD